MSWQCLHFAEHNPRHGRGLKDPLKTLSRQIMQTTNCSMREKGRSATWGIEAICYGSKGTMKFEIEQSGLQIHVVTTQRKTTGARNI